MRLADISFGDLFADPNMVAHALAGAIARNVEAEWHIFMSLAVALVIGALADARAGQAALGRFLHRRFRVDATYAVFDILHVTHFLVIAPLGFAVLAFLTAHASWMRVDSLAALPIWFQASLLWIFSDCWTYWYHRLQHVSPVMWQFHKTHHSQEELTALSVFRVTIIDRVVNLLALSVPAAMMSVSFMMPLTIVMLLQFHGFITHSGIGWTFGPLEKFFVSPSFHEVHHSRAPQHQDRNFGAVLAIWDYIFGSHAPRGPGKLEFGLSHESIPESYLGQFFVPLVGLWRLATRSAPRESRL